MWGLFWYDITKAEKFVKAEDIGEIPIEKLSPLVDYPRNPQDIMGDMTKVPVCIEHLDHIDMTKPIILAYRPKDFEEGKRKILVVDGHHRIARAIRDGLKSLQAYLLSEEETDKILTDNRPKKRKRRKKNEYASN